MTKRSRSCTTAFVASIEQQTALWERRNDKGGWYCQHREDGYSKVVFGKVGRNHSDRGVDFCSEEALKFCESSEEAYKKGTRMPHMAILMVRERKREEGGVVEVISKKGTITVFVRG